MSNWSELAAWVALALGILSFSDVKQLKRFVGFTAFSRKWKKAIGGKIYTPKHLPEKFPSRMPDEDRNAIKPYSNVAPHLNLVLSETSWRFEDTGEIDSEDLGDGNPRRKIDIRYNQARAGKIYVSVWSREDPISPDKKIRIKIILDNARQFDGQDVYDLALSASKYVQPISAHSLSAQETILAGMLKTCWRTGDDVDVHLVLELNFEGSGEYWREVKWRSDE